MAQPLWFTRTSQTLESMTITKSKTFKMTRYFLLVIGNILIFGLILVVVEGLASFILAVRDITKTYTIAEVKHTKYDPDLGWVNEPSAHIRDMYGPGIYLRTNSQGFRGDHDFDSAVPNGKYRIICSGYSFTLGYGVDNDHTWCQRLTSLDPRLETVNMGQGGYGIDQMYLWYKRDGAKFEHQVHLLAFITPDFYRMQSDSFGRGKPVIDIENGTLVVKNVPVPRRAYPISWLTYNSANLKRFRIVELLMRVREKLWFVPYDASPLSAKERNEKTQEVLTMIFKDLKRLNKERSSKLVLVYLPLEWELLGNSPFEQWMKFIEKESRDLDIPLINVLSTFQSLPHEDVVKLFIPEGQVKLLAAAGHLNDQGNEFVASVIYQALKNNPAISPIPSPKNREVEVLEGG